MKKKRKLKKKPIIILSIILFFIIIAIFVITFKDFIFKKEEKPKTLEKEEVVTLSMLVAGNILQDQKIITDGIVKTNEYKFDYIFKDIKEIKNKHDLKYYNQESIIGGSKLGYSSNNKYNSPKEIGDFMISSGFNLVSLSNRHSYDKGKDGINNSLEYFKTKDIVYSGQGLEESIIKNIKGINYTLLSYTMDTIIPLKEDLVSIYSKDKVKKDIEKLKDKVDLIIVSISWKDLESSDITDEQKDIANYLSTLGVDILIGNGSYIQKIDKVNDMLVIYSSGNLLSNYSIVDKDTSMITNFKINFSLTKNKITNSTIEDITSKIIYTSSKNGVNFKLIEYPKLTDKILKNHKDYYKKYSDIIKSNIDIKIEK